MACDSKQKSCCDDGGNSSSSSVPSASDTPRVSRQEPVPCESTTPSTALGCCSNGRSCDEVCIQVAAAYECRTICATTADHQDQSTPEKVSCTNGNQSGPTGIGSDCCKGSSIRSGDCCSNVSPVDEANENPATDALCQSTCCSPEESKDESRPCDTKIDNSGVLETTYPNSSCQNSSVPGRDCDLDAVKEGRTASSCCATQESEKSTCSKALTATNDELRCVNGYSGDEYANDVSTMSSNTGTYIGSGHKAPASQLSSLDKHEDRDTVVDTDSSPSFGQACASHLQAAFRQYTAYLESGRCICRSVLQPLDTCCSQDKRAAAVRKSKATSTFSRGRAMSKKATEAPKTCCGRETNECTGAQEVTEAKRSSHEISPISCEDNCCGDPVPPTKTKQFDIENGSAREIVLLSVSGMTCTGCANKLSSALSRIDGVSNAKVNFVASMAEFALNQEVVPATDSIISQLSRDTGFECTRITSNLQCLDVIMTQADAKQYEERRPTGIDTISKSGNRTFRISYDPTIIGARQVMLSAQPAKLAPPSNESALATDRKLLMRMSLSFVLAAICTIPVAVLAWSPHRLPYTTRSVVSLVLATVVQAVAIPHFYQPAINALIFTRIVEMDMLVVISITAAYGYSVVAFALTHAGYHLVESEFFETSTLLITLVLLGRLIATLARLRAYNAVSFKSLQAQSAQLVQADKETTEVDARLLEFGDVISIPAHSRIVTDGIVTYGASSVDESMLTGESMPVPKKKGDTVVAGTMNGPSTLHVRITRLPGKNSINDIADLVKDALGSAPRIQELADRIAGYFIPMVCSVAMIVFVVWLVVGFKVRHENAGGAVGMAITYAIAVLAISCPCALGLAVPMVLVIASGVAARAGVVIKQAIAIERAHSVSHVVFDKTGTLTTGTLEIVSEHVSETAFTKKTVQAMTRALVKDNQHPISTAVADSLENAEADSISLNKIESIPGRGMCAEYQGQNVRAGNPYWLNIADHADVARLIREGLTLFCVTIENAEEPLAIYGLKSTIRPEAAAVVANLQARGITSHIVSGDGPLAVTSVANSLGIPLANIASQHTPAAKETYVKNLKSRGKNVVFCGDGTNDAIAIAQANTGIQMGNTSDITGAVADVVLLGGLEGIPMLLDLSKRTYRRIMFNFVWSGVYNLFAILLAGGAFVRVRIPPAYAGLGEIVSVLPVILVALTLLGFKRNS